MEAVRALQLDGLRDPEVEARLLARRSVDQLTGFAWSSTAELAEGFEKLNATDILDVAARAKQTALIMLPAGVRRAPVGFEYAPTGSRFAVDGKRHRSRVDHDIVLVLADDGVSVVTADGPATVLYAECAALLRWPDGGRRLIGTDAISVAIEPAYYPMTSAAMAAVDASVPVEKHVDLPERHQPVPSVSRFKAWRTRLRRFRLPWLARLDRFAAFRGGRTNVLITTAVGMIALVLIFSATFVDQGVACPAIISASAFVWRWNATKRR